MSFEIRPMRAEDVDAVAALSLRATFRKAGFTPVPSEHLYLLLDADG